jgi:type II secretory pathway pseudopilin PulG
MLLGRIFGRGDPGHEKNMFWIEATAEFVLVVVGILLALQIENWNQDRKDRKLERTLLEEMLSNLQSDLQDVDYNIGYNQVLIHSSEIVIDYLDSDRPYNDSLNSHFANITGGTIFVANTSAFESLESIGIDLIRNDTLRQKITSLYSGLYNYLRKLEDGIILHIQTGLNPQMAKHIRPVSQQNAVPLDPSGLKDDNEFYSVLKNNVSYLRLQILSYQRCKNRIEELIHTIEKELNQ